MWNTHDSLLLKVKEAYSEGKESLRLGKEKYKVESASNPW